MLLSEPLHGLGEKHSVICSLIETKWRIYVSANLAIIGSDNDGLPVPSHYLNPEYGLIRNWTQDQFSVKL